MAAYLGYTFVDAADLLFFDQNGAIDEAKTLAAYQRLAASSWDSCSRILRAKCCRSRTTHGARRV